MNNNNNNNNKYGTSLQEAPLSVSKEEPRSGWLNLKSLPQAKILKI